MRSKVLRHTLKNKTLKNKNFFESITGLTCQSAACALQAVFVPPESQYGSLLGANPTTRHPSLPASKLTAPVTPQGNGQPSGPLQTEPAGQQQQQQPAVLPDYSWQLRLQQIWEAHCLGYGHGPAAMQGSGLHHVLPTFPPLPGVLACLFIYARAQL
jgi:hypothetical protein